MFSPVFLNTLNEFHIKHIKYLNAFLGVTYLSCKCILVKIEFYFPIGNTY